MDRKMIPVVLMLFAGAVCSIITYRYEYDNKSSLVILALVLVLFYCFGLFIRKIMQKFETVNQKELQERQEKEAELTNEGEVIEKETV